MNSRIDANQTQGLRGVRVEQKNVIFSSAYKPSACINATNLTSPRQIQSFALAHIIQRQLTLDYSLCSRWANSRPSAKSV